MTRSSTILSRLPGGIPTAWVVLGAPFIAIFFVSAYVLTNKHKSIHESRTMVARAALLFEDRDDGSVTVLRSRDRSVLEVMPPDSNAFVRVLLSGLVRERRREGQADREKPFVLVRWSTGAITLDDSATHHAIELNSFGPTNASSFSRLLDEATAPN